MCCGLDLMVRARVRGEGIVQGVGFRPFVYSLATEHDLGGWVLNDGEGVLLEVEGPREQVRRFVDSLADSCPTVASLENLTTELLEPLGIPITLGILPLRTSRHAEFLHQKVAGIVIPEPVRKRMSQAKNSVAEGAAKAREMLFVARQYFAGACVMPPFGHYEMLFDILR